LASDLLSFLTQPRTIAEIAERFRLSTETAEALVMREVEAGKILVSSATSPNTNPITTPPDQSSIANSLFETSTKHLGQLKLPKTGSTRTAAKIGVSNRGLPRLKTQKPITIRREPEPLRLDRIAGKKLDPPENRGRASLTLRARVIEALDEGSKTPMQLKSQFNISRETLDTMVRRKVLAYEWGPSGVGLRFKPTEKGRDLLREFRAAMAQSRELAKRKLISSKVAVPD